MHRPESKVLRKQVVQDDFKKALNGTKNMS